MQLLDAPLAIVDLETTGANASWDRITEIALIEIDGGGISGEWSTLVNPQTAIPPAIQALTGITNDMVAHAPTFAELARGLHERLAGRVVVAHNARFDYGFLRHAFEREGIRYAARTLCTVKLSRRLYPGHARHNLDSLIARHGLKCRARHRAPGDADAVWQFLRVAAAEHGAGALADAGWTVAGDQSAAVARMADPAGIERELCPQKILIETVIGRFKGEGSIEKLAEVIDALLEERRAAGERVVIERAGLRFAFHAESHHQRRKHGAGFTGRKAHSKEHLASG